MSINLFLSSKILKSKVLKKKNLMSMLNNPLQVAGKGAIIGQLLLNATKFLDNVLFY